MNARQRRGYWRVFNRYMKEHDDGMGLSMYSIQTYQAAEIVSARTMWKRVKR
jgi:hypothetical protein